MTTDDMDGEPSVSLMIGNPRTRFESGQDDAKVVVLDKRPGIVTALPLRFVLELINFPLEIEFEERCRHGLRVRSSVQRVFVYSVSHDFLRLSGRLCT